MKVKVLIAGKKPVELKVNNKGEIKDKLQEEFKNNYKFFNVKTKTNLDTQNLKEGEDVLIKAVSKRIKLG